MNINTNSWHYKQYLRTFKFFWHVVPLRTNLCAYVQRIFWFSLFMYLVMACTVIVYIVGALLWSLILVPVLFFFGVRPFSFPWQKGSWDPEDFGLYEGLFGWLKPYHVGLAVGFFFFENWLWHKNVTLAIEGHAIVLLLVLVTSFVFWLSSKGESSRLAKSWLSAKTNKVCPLVEFTDKPTSYSPFDRPKEGFQAVSKEDLEYLKNPPKGE